MNGYMDMLPMLASIGTAIPFVILDAELGRFCDENGQIVESSDAYDILSLPIEKFSDFKSINNRVESGQIVSAQIPRMLLIGIVSSLDHHLVQIMKEVIRKNPKIITNSERNISVQDVFQSESIEDFKEILIEREIDNVSNGTFEDQIIWFQNKLKIDKPIRDDYDQWSELVEIIERRNLFAHANGVVNNRYLKKINPYGMKEKLKVGDELFASSKYFSSALDNICEFGVKLAQVVWRKIDPQDSANADNDLGDFGFALIERGEYKLATRVLEFANSLRGKKDEARRRMDIVNLANAFKLDGNKEKALSILDGEDWGIVSDNFAVCVAAVKDEVDEVLRYMRRIAKDDMASGDEFEQWPVFFGVREDHRFVDEFESLFKRKFVASPKSRNRILENHFKDKKQTTKPRKGRPSSPKRIEGRTAG